MARNLTAAERREKSAAAYELKTEGGLTYAEVGKRLGISRQLASVLVGEERERRRLELPGEKEIDHLKAVQREAWARLERLDPNSTYVVKCLRDIIRAQKRMDRITGVAELARRKSRGLP